MADVPAHCPYKLNDWVRRHGYPGDMPGPARWGWRGFVTGYIGGTILIGVTDDGMHWSEEWGSLCLDEPNPNRAPTFCVCCPRPAVFKAPAPPLTLFDLELIGRG